MNPKRRSRLVVIVFLFVGAAVSIGLILTALSENLNLFYPPQQVADGTAPAGSRIRAGGMVAEGSVQRVGEGLDVEFVLTDFKGGDFTVRYTGILPDLFREGQGVLVEGELVDGELGHDRIFVADNVLAKHDENYMPPELADLARSQSSTAETAP